MKNIFLIIAMLSVAAILFSFYMFRKKRMSIKAFLLWQPVWISVAVFSFWPDLTSNLLVLVNMEVRAYFVFIVGLVFVMFMTFINNLSEARSSRDIHLLMQEIALLKFYYEELRRENDENRAKQ